MQMLRNDGVEVCKQVSNRPPAFAAFIAGAEEMGDNTTKFLLNALRKKFGFPGVPLRLVVRHKGQVKPDLQWDCLESWPFHVF